MSDVATTIHKQITTIAPLAFMSWGASKFVRGDDSLSFQVGGLAMLKGRVQVKLNSNDLYDVSFVNFRRKFDTTTVNDVFVEDLVKVIDKNVG
jgi:hypothetical protein